jgi:hypothetical protein
MDHKPSDGFAPIFGADRVQVAPKLKVAEHVRCAVVALEKMDVQLQPFRLILF